MYCTNVFIKNT